MQGYKLSKKYILKMMIFRVIILLAIDISYALCEDKIPIKLEEYILIALYGINILGAIISLIMPFIEYLAYKYYIYEDFVEIKRGIIFRRAVYIPIENIKYIIIVRDPLDNLLGLNNLKLYTTAGHRVIKAVDDQKSKVLWNIMKDDLNSKGS